MHFSLLNVIRRGGGRGKVGWLVNRIFAPKKPARVREIWRWIFSLDKASIRITCWLQPAPGESSPVKRVKFSMDKSSISTRSLRSASSRRKLTCKKSKIEFGQSQHKNNMLNSACSRKRWLTYIKRDKI